MLSLIPLEKVPAPGRAHLRLEAQTAIYGSGPAGPFSVIKIVLLIALRFSTMGWFQVLQGEAYAGARVAGYGLGDQLGCRRPGRNIRLGGGCPAGVAGLPAPPCGCSCSGPLSLALFVPRPERTP